MREQGLGNWEWRGSSIACLVAIVSLAAFPCLAMTSSEAVAIVLNSRNAAGADTFAAATKRVESDAAEGKPLQQFVIGVTTKDKELAKRYLDASRGKIRALAVVKGNPLAWYLLSIENNDLKLLRKAADGGNVQALNALGTIETQEALARDGISSNDLERVLVRSFELFGKAAEKSDPNGLVNLGACYLQGYGCKPDRAKAYSCFKAAAEAGHPEGMDNLSDCYRFGHGVKKDNELCLYWTMRGRSARGDLAAAQWLRDRK